MLSKSVEYAIKSLVLINNKPNHINVELISDELNIPKNFTSKILQLLTKKGYIISRKGPGGGFIKDNYKNTIKQLIIDIDGNFRYNRCVINDKECNDISHCPLHDHFKGIRSKILNEFMEISIEEICKNDQNLLNLISIEEVEKLQAHQDDGRYHPYTCCSYDGCQRSPENNWGTLIPTQEQWVCPCGRYKQNYKL